MNKPLVSIGMPVFNAERYLASSLRSLLAQDYPNLEMIISDNGSTDRTRKICEEISKEEPRVKFHRNDENLGLFGNFNNVFEMSQGDFFMWAGAHDLWESNFISACLSTLLLHPNAVLCAGEYREIDEHGKFLKIIPVYPQTIGLPPAERLRWVVRDLGSCFAVYSLIRREALRKTGGFINKFGADTVLVAELSQIGDFVTTASTRVYMRAFGDRKYTTEENIIRLVGERNARSRDKTFPYAQQMLELLHVIYHAPLSTGEKFSLVLETVNQWKGAAFKDLVRPAKRVFAR